MRKSLKCLLLLSVIFTVSLSIMRLRGQSSTAQTRNGQSGVDETQFPIAEEAAQEPSEPAGRTKKKNKEKKYSGHKDTIGPGITVSTAFYDWPPGFPTLPVAQSDAVLIGEVTDAKAFMTSDKATVYSEFTIQINEVLKNDDQPPLSPGGSIIAERPGGRVRYSSGHVSRFSIVGWGMPRIKRRYVLFLTRNNQEESYRIVTGYGLHNGRVSPLDMTTSSETDFDVFINSDVTSFLNRLRAVVRG